MKKYPTPKLFNPSPEDMKRVAEKVAKSISKNKYVVTADGQKIKGKKAL